MVFVIYQAFSIVHQLVREDRMHREAEMTEGQDGLRYSKFSVPLLWDWNSTSQAVAEDARLQTAEAFELLQVEEQLANVLKVGGPDCCFRCSLFIL